MKMCFEPENLLNASPATVSRAGIIYVSDTVLGWLRCRRIGQPPRAGAAFLKPLFEKIASEMQEFVRNQLKTAMTAGGGSYAVDVPPTESVLQQSVDDGEILEETISASVPLGLDVD